MADTTLAELIKLNKSSKRAPSVGVYVWYRQGYLAWCILRNLLISGTFNFSGKLRKFRHCKVFILEKQLPTTVTTKSLNEVGLVALRWSKPPEWSRCFWIVDCLVLLLVEFKVFQCSWCPFDVPPAFQISSRFHYLEPQMSTGEQLLPSTGIRASIMKTFHFDNTSVY